MKMIKDTRGSEILHSALLLGQQEGFERLTMARLAEHAGCAVGSVYREFASKEDVLLALSVRVLQAVAPAVESVVVGQAYASHAVLRYLLAGLHLRQQLPWFSYLLQLMNEERVWDKVSAKTQSECQQFWSQHLKQVTEGVKQAADQASTPLSTLQLQQLLPSFWALLSGYEQSRVHPVWYQVLPDLTVSINNPFMQSLLSLINLQPWARQNPLDAFHLQEHSGDISEHLAGIIELFNTQVADTWALIKVA